MINLPLKYKERMKILLEDEFDAYINALEEPPVRAFRVNTDKISVKNFAEIDNFSEARIPYVENGFYFKYEKIGNHPYHHAGMLYVQEPAAMAPAECIDINPDWKILDMCAAPGGKSTQLKNKLGQNGVLVSNEIIPSRCKILTGNIERLGLKNTVTTCTDTSKLAEIFPKTFDLVMVDAPCSGEGMFRKEENAVDEWSIENICKCVERQKNILENAASTVKNGGYIIYATCTFSLEENEMTVDDFLKNHSEFEIVPVKEAVKVCTADGIRFNGCKCENIELARRFYPHKSKGEGQFMAVLKNKLEPAAAKNKFSAKQAQADSSVFNFLDDVLENYDKSRIIMNKSTPVYFTNDFEVPNGIAFSCGVTIGEIKKNYILPHHQLFMAMGNDFKRKINLTADSLEIAKYLHGEEFDTDCQNGWAVVTVNGCSVGGVKVTNGKAKNHYPKGLRIK